MAKTKKELYEVMNYCKKEDLFTSGDIVQYNKMLAACDSEYVSAHDVAVMIWICSDTEKSIEQIEKDISCSEQANVTDVDKIVEAIQLIDRRIARRESLRVSVLSMGWLKKADLHLEAEEELRSLKEEILGAQND